MPGRLRPQLTYANVMATIAVFIAMGGGAYALTIPKNSVGATQIKRNAVRASEIKRGAVTSAKVRDRSLLTKDFKQGQLPKGDKGDRGDKGDPGASSAPAAVTVRVGGLLTAGANGSGAGCVDGVPGGSKGFRDAGGTLISCGGGTGGSSATTVSCAAGETATGGGYTYASGKRHALVTESVPSPAGAGQAPTGWRIKVETLTDDSSNNTPVTPYAVCIRP